MTIISRLADSCLTVATEEGTTLFDPGFFSFDTDFVDLDDLGEVQRVLITHEHADHVKPEFVRWLIDRGDDVEVFGNQAVADLLLPHDIEVAISNPNGVTSEDVLHEMLPNGARPPNRSWTIDGVLTHPGDSHEPNVTAPILALPCLMPWGSMTGAVAFAKRVAPLQVIPIHDFYLSESGRQTARHMASGALKSAGIELIPLDWNDSYTV
jgi:L-ascorbate metabolism protein UlaG (beta-lactamase superfamily)